MDTTGIDSHNVLPVLPYIFTTMCRRVCEYNVSDKVYGYELEVYRYRGLVMYTVRCILVSWVSSRMLIYYNISEREFYDVVYTRHWITNSDYTQRRVTKERVGYLNT